MTTEHDATSKKLNDVWSKGFAEDEYGFTQNGGFAAALIIKGDLYGIIEETVQGFVDYEVFATETAARDRWQERVEIWHGEFYPEAAVLDSTLELE